MHNTDAEVQEKRLRELERSEKTLHTILASTTTGIGVIQNRIMKWHNRAMNAMLGYTPEELRGKHARILYSDDNEFQRVGKTIASLGYHKKTASIQTKWRRKDGSEFDCLIRYALLESYNGEGAALAMVEDITDRKRAASELRKSEARYRDILNNIEDGYYEVDLAGNLTFFNDSLCTLFGISRQDLLGMNNREYTDEETAKKIFTVFHQVYITGISAKTFDWEIVRRDGERRHVEASVSLMKDDNGKPIGFQGIVRDVTERKSLRRKLEASEERYRSLVENTMDGYFICEIPSTRVLFANQRTCDLIGYHMKEILKRRLLDFLDPQEKPVLENRLGTWLEGKTLNPARYVYTVKRKDGSTFKVEAATSRVMFEGRPAMQGVFKDVTEHERLERQLQQAQKMEAIGTLAGGIAHDFNNLLQAILGYSQILALGKEPDDPELVRLQQIENSAMRASELTQQLLTFSRKVESKLRPVDLNLEVRQVEKLLKRTIPKMISIELQLQDDLQVVNADPAQVEQVMMNLAVNARDAMPEGGKIIIETENVFLDQHYCRTHAGAVVGRYVRLSFTDTGQGMEKEAVEHIFEPFYTTKELGKGTGLGLSMVYGIVKSHKGYIMCYSEPNVGTIFKIYLPAVESESKNKEAKQKEQEKIAGGDETILLVDDEELLQDIGKQILEQFGYTVLTAPDGETALELYDERREEISLIILDLMMPGMGGKQCLEKLLATAPDAKVLIASGYSLDGPAKTVLEAGAKGFINKPFELQQMLKMVRTVLDKEKS
jgi:two-component system cell cycle sensor histidine kinase/response regulator CckA